MGYPRQRLPGDPTDEAASSPAIHVFMGRAGGGPLLVASAARSLFPSLLSPLVLKLRTIPFFSVWLFGNPGLNGGTSVFLLPFVTKL